MPQINITVTERVDEKTKDELQLEIGRNMEILPGKSIENTVICIYDGCSMFKGGRSIKGAFVDIRLFKASQEECKEEFSKKLFSIFETVLGIEPDYIYMNFIELPHWASNGEYS